MANLYYNAAVDTAWDTLGNWWENAGHNTPAAAIPANGDTVYLSGAMNSGPSTSVTLANINVLIDAVNFTGAIGNATFSTDSFNDGTVTGNATFNGTSQNSSGTIVGDATFNDTSSNNARVEGNATFNNSSVNDGDCYSGTFNDYSYNSASGVPVLSGQAIFNDYSYNEIGSYEYIGGIFNDNSANYSNQLAICVFNDNSTNSADVSHAEFYGPYAFGRIGLNTRYSYRLDVNMTAPSGGGSDNTIARLLDLPWFINL
jgi:hypothetical protein